MASTRTSTRGRASWLPITDERQLLIAGLFMIAAFILLHLGGLLAGRWVWQVERLFRFGGEANVPSWASSVLWVLAALAAMGCAQGSRATSDRRTWRWLAVGLLLASCDEAAMIHEELGRSLQRAIASATNARDLVLPWSLTLGPLAVAAAVWIWRRMQRSLASSSPARRYLQAGLMLAFGSAIGLELLEKYVTAAWAQALETVVEESCEMIGGLLILVGLLLHQRRLQQRPAPRMDR